MKEEKKEIVDREQMTRFETLQWMAREGVLSMDEMVRLVYTEPITENQALSVLADADIAASRLSAEKDAEKLEKPDVMRGAWWKDGLPYDKWQEKERQGAREARAKITGRHDAKFATREHCMAYVQASVRPTSVVDGMLLYGLQEVIERLRGNGLTEDEAALVAEAETLMGIMSGAVRMDDVQANGRTEAMYAAAVMHDVDAMRRVPEERLTRTVLEAAFQNVRDGEQLLDVMRSLPDGPRRMAVLEAALSRTLLARKIDIMPALRGAAMDVPGAWAAALHGPLYGIVTVPRCSLVDVPEEMHVPEVLEAAVSAFNRGKVIEIIPEGRLTTRVCELAAANGADITKIPERFRSERVCVECAETYKKWAGWHPALPFMAWIPAESKTSRVYAAALRHGQMYLDEVPEEHRDMDVCRAGLVHTYADARHIPPQLRLPELYFGAFRENLNVVLAMPDWMAGPTVWKAALMRDPKGFERMLDQALPGIRTEADREELVLFVRDYLRKGNMLPESLR